MASHTTNASVKAARLHRATQTRSNTYSSQEVRKTLPYCGDKVAEKIVLNGVQFDFNKAVIKAEYNPVLDAAASALQKQGDKKVMITGYTCSMGPEAYNLKLSEKRAAAVKAYLVDKGISASRLMTKGDGEANPVGDNKTKTGREMNRRAELVVIN